MDIQGMAFEVANKEHWSWRSQLIFTSQEGDRWLLQMILVHITNTRASQHIKLLFSDGIFTHLSLGLSSGIPVDRIIWTQNGHHFADNVFKCIFMNEKFCILNRLSLKFVPKGLIDNIPAFVQIMAWCRSGEYILLDQSPIDVCVYSSHCSALYAIVCNGHVMGSNSTFKS